MTTPAPRIGLVTCAELPEPDHDEELLLRALVEHGARARLLPWNGAGPVPADFDLCVLRSSWDYHLAPEAFRRWIEAAAEATTLLNAPAALLWNVHKGYLRELEGEGVPVVPTLWFERGSRATLETPEWEEVVVKPAISAGSFGTRRFRAGDPAATTFLHERTAEGDAMVQPFLRSVERTGERALVWIDGELTHAIRKEPRYAEDEESVSEALVPTAEERRFAERALAPVLRRFGGGLLYARVDVMTSEAGEPWVSELELLEPSLFLLQSPPALERFVRALLGRAQRARRA